jgi:hypothetical protein
MSPTRQGTYCPNCQVTFNDPSSVIQHLNHLYSSCARWLLPGHTLTNTSPAPTPCTSALIDPVTTSIEFPTTGRVFDHSGGFMGDFHADKFSEERSQNMFYPFSSKREWQLALFLSRSGLSMRIVDEFLSLDLVSAMLLVSTGQLTTI